VIPIKYTTTRKGYPQLPAAEVTRMKDRISSFAGSDRARKLREEALNQLEGFTYKVRDFLDDEAFVAVSTPEERSSLEAKGKDASDWMYTPEGRDATREELKAKLREMEDIVGPIQVRKEEAASLPDQLKVLEEALNATKYTIIAITGQIENDTKIHADFSSSKSAAATATPSPSPVDEFADLEDDATETVSAPVEEETLEPPTYTTADLVKPQEVFDVINEWLAEVLPKQKALKPTDNPVILTKEVAAKAKQLQDIQVDLIMKSMKRPYKSSRPTTKSKTKPKTKKPKKSSKTASADKAGATVNLEDMMKDDFVKVGENGDMPTQEELKAFLEKYQSSEEGQKDEFKLKQPGERVENFESAEGEKKHDEL